MSAIVKKLISKNVLNGIIMTFSVGFYIFCSFFNFPVLIPVLVIPVVLLLLLRTR